MNFSEMEQTIYTLSGSPRVGKEVYPQRVRRLLEKQGFDPMSLVYIHTAGSKGKGSLSRSAFHLLIGEGVSTGLFVSPHIFNICERIETQEGEISRTEFTALADEFLILFQKEELHFFEALLFMALVYFLRKGCTHAVLEVGVGGRYDPTNFCKPALILMGHISMEHKEFLGGSLESIAFDKAGVLKEGAPALSLDQAPSVEEVFRREKAKLYFWRDILSINNLQKTPWGSRFDCTAAFEGRLFFWENINLRRLGRAALDNFTLAAAGAGLILPSLKTETVLKAAEEEIPFRLQKIGERFLADTAHNGQSFLNLCRCVDEWLGWQEAVLYVSLLEGKEYGDIADVLRVYRRLWKKIRVFEFPAKGMRPSNGRDFFTHLEGLPAEYMGLLPEGHRFEGGGPVVWAGSFYSIEYLFKLLGAEGQR